jgi:hypothetical protein
VDIIYETQSLFLRKMNCGAASFVGCLFSFALRSVDDFSSCRLFGILQLSFSQHIARASAVHHPAISVQSTHRASVGSLVSSAFRSADIRALQAYAD